MTDAERRFASQFNEGADVPVQVRAASVKTIGGYAAKFDRMSQNLGGFKERIAPGFFNYSRSQGWPQVLARYNHDDNMLLGTTGANTLRLDVDSVGLTYEVDVPDARADVYELTQRGDVRQSSFAFYADEDAWDQDDTGFARRTLISGRLFDVAPVNVPAYLDTSVGLRSLATFMHADPDEVRALAAAGEVRKLFVRTDSAPTAPTFGGLIGGLPNL
ncbi:HK97 family phage prohead protease [Occultella gossypii]|uniref:HK97 family phage prohead protease n=1 Tax=Occultella gossypii TaxID=2800820 RepID=A0ABS7SA96_9MICO|nr:HK97 family phage prohead protease [Occultella gossypii]MBZ2197268.1 HK97 family phage prohead protease [Occultella gossypii]